MLGVAELFLEVRPNTDEKINDSEHFLLSVLKQKTFKSNKLKLKRASKLVNNLIDVNDGNFEKIFIECNKPILEEDKKMIIELVSLMRVIYDNDVINFEVIRDKYKLCIFAILAKDNRYDIIKKYGFPLSCACPKYKRIIEFCCYFAGYGKCIKAAELLHSFGVNNVYDLALKGLNDRLRDNGEYPIESKSFNHPCYPILYRSSHCNSIIKSSQYVLGIKSKTYPQISIMECVTMFIIMFFIGAVFFKLAFPLNF